MKKQKKTRGKPKPSNQINRLDELYKEIEVQIYMTDEEDLILLASLYMTSAFNLFAAQRGSEKTKIIFQEFTNTIKIPQKDSILAK